MNWFYTLLSQLSSPHLEMVSWTVYSPVVAVLDVIDWARIEHILTTLPSASPVQFRIILNGPDEVVQEATQLINGRLPLLMARGVVCEKHLRCYPELGSQIWE